MIKFFCIFIFTVTVMAEEPWSISRSHPVTLETTEIARGQRQSGKSMSGSLFRFFQKYISPLDGATCRYRPTCSLYTTRAVERYGIIHGTVMGIDRLIRCHTGQTEYFIDPPIHY